MLTSRIAPIAYQAPSNSFSNNTQNQTNILICDMYALANQTANLANQTATLNNKNDKPLEPFLSLGGTIAGVAAALFAGLTIRRESKGIQVKNLSEIFDKVYQMSNDLATASESKTSIQYKNKAKRFVTYMDMVAHLTLKGEIKREIARTFNPAFADAMKVLREDLPNLYNQLDYFGSLRLWYTKEELDKK